jgi:hypothetical protein
MEYIKKHMILPGQIEQWVVITNMSKLSVTELPTKEIKALAAML